MIYSPQGAVAHVLWDEIKNRSDRAYTGSFVVMPDHIHGIITLRPIDKESEIRLPGEVKACLDPARNLDTSSIQEPITKMNSPNDVSDPILDQYLENLEKLMRSNEWPGDKRFQNIGSQTLSSVVGSYKSAVTKHLNRMGLSFAWQRLYHDFLITDENEDKRISKYIENNPRKWWMKHGPNG